MHEYKSQQGSREERVRNSYSMMAPAVIHAIMSTFLAIAVTGFSEGYIFVAFFRLWIGIVVFGAIFAMYITPTVLLFIGPPSDIHDEEEKEYEIKDNHESNNANETT
jgi:hypothetical protein